MTKIDRTPFPVNLPAGTQVLYVPTHLEHIEDMGVQPGFIVRRNNTDDGYFVRYFYPLQNNTAPGPKFPTLRTLANAENTPDYVLMRYTFTTPEHIHAIYEILYGPLTTG